MENLVAVINKLQDVFTTIGTDPIQLPQIIVVGAQSSGKSSVLESIAGKPFLPRGTGVVTRRPLVLQLVQCLKSDPRRSEGSPDDWGVFHHDPNKVYRNFSDIKTEIEAETDRRAGMNKGICTEPIVLKIFSTKVLSLTLVDLPGLTKVPVGDQPKDIETTIRELILSYIRNPNSVILAVVTANTDMETSESLQLAREVDPEGDRTIAVVTKLDLMDAGTDAMDILEGRVVPVKLGIVGVVNRSQKDINNQLSIEEALVNEATFLHRYYRNIASKHGTAYLSKTLQAILIKHIKSYLPDLKHKVHACMAKYQADLSSLGRDLKSHDQSLLDILTGFSSSYSASIEGTCAEVGTHDLEGGARIGYIFHETFTRTINHLDPLQGFDRSAILTAMRNASGTKPALFIPELCFELLVKKQISKLTEPALCCIQLVNDELERLIDHCGNGIRSEMLRFPKLRAKIVEVVSALIKSRVEVTNDMVKKLIQIHTAYINTAHPDFVAETLKIQTPSDSNDLKQKSITSTKLDQFEPRVIRGSNDDSVCVVSKVPRDCLFIEKLVICYFNIVRKTIADTVPKAIMFFMVNYVINHLLSELVNNVYSHDKAAELLEENTDIARQRERTKNMLNALQKADIIINEVKETKLW